jgi:hypothetical protein
MFEISINGWTSDLQGVQLPICQVLSSQQISVARMEPDSYPSSFIDINLLSNGTSAISRILWSASRIYVMIGPINVVLINVGSSVGCFFYAIGARFTVNSKPSENSQGIENLFLRLDDGEVFKVS